MSRRLEQLVHVAVDRRGWPLLFKWGQRQLRVRRIEDDWEEAGCWWLGEEPRRVFRLSAGNGAVYELHYQPSSHWRLHSIVD